MNGWMDGWMNNWMDGWMNNWMDGWMDAFVGLKLMFYLCGAMRLGTNARHMMLVTSFPNT